MKRKIFRLIYWIVGILLISSLAFYISVSVFYCNGFTYGTWINGIYCTGLDIDSADSLLVNAFDDTKLVFSSERFEDETILLEDIDFNISYKESLSKLYDSQNAWLWPVNLFKKYDSSNFEPVISYDSTKLKDAILKLNFMSEFDENREQIVRIDYESESGYYLNSQLYDCLYAEDVMELAESSFKADLSVFVSDETFSPPVINDEIEAVFEEWTKLTEFLSTKIVYDMGAEKINIDGSVLSLFLIRNNDGSFKKNEDGSYYINESAALSYIDDLCDMYSTYKKPRDYTTFLGETKHINLSTYGTLLNKSAEEEYFLNALKSSLEEIHTPKYLHEGFVKGLNDIGYTFVEVDLTNQILYYVVDGSLIMQCDIVSGKPYGGNETPEVVAYLIRKSRNTYLRGADYVSFVKYWMPFYGGDGLHDASWQKAFGGDRYKRYGSHGCINMRLEDVSSLYEMIEVGTPIIVYK